MANHTIDQTKMAALLGRPLTATETANFDLYLDIAKMRLTDLLCFDFTDPEELEKLPNDLMLVWARFFGIMGAEASEMQASDTKTKRVEDFYITYRDDHSVLADLIDKNSATIAKYSKCSSGIRHGRTIFDAGGCYDCI